MAFNWAPSRPHAIDIATSNNAKSMNEKQRAEHASAILAFYLNQSSTKHAQSKFAGALVRLQTNMSKEEKALLDSVADELGLELSEKLWKEDTNRIYEALEREIRLIRLGGSVPL